MNQGGRVDWQEARDRFVRGLVLEDFVACVPYIELVEREPTASRDLADAFSVASKQWLAEVANEFGRHLKRTHGLSRALSFYRLALDAGVDVRLNMANLLADDPQEIEQAERLYRDVIADGDVDGLNNLAQLLTNR